MKKIASLVTVAGIILCNNASYVYGMQQYRVQAATADELEFSIINQQWSHVNEILANWSGPVPEFRLDGIELDTAINCNWEHLARLLMTRMAALEKVPYLYLRDLPKDLNSAIRNEDWMGLDILLSDWDGPVPVLEGIDLWTAVKLNLVHVAEVLIDQGARVRVRNREDRDQTMLHRAVENDNQKLVELLIKHGAEINAKDRNGETPLHYAAHNNSVDLIKLLLSKGADVNAKDKGDYTALHSAVQGYAREALEILCDVKGVNINSADYEGKTPLHWALTKNSKWTVEFLIMRGADAMQKDNSGMSPWRSREVQEVFDKIVERFSQQSSKSVEASSAEMSQPQSQNIVPVTLQDLENAVESADWVKVDAILDKWEGEVPSLEGANLWNVTKENLIHIAEALLNKGVDVNAKDENGKTPLDIAIEHNRKRMAALLINKGAIVNSKDETIKKFISFLLFVAIGENNKNLVEILIGNGADVNIDNGHGMNPLLDAARLHRYEIFDLLMSRGANLSDRDRERVINMCPECIYKIFR